MPLLLPFMLSQALAVPAVAPPAPEPIASYTLEARLDAESHRISASGTIRFKNPSARPTHELYFHLYLNAFSNQETLFLRGRGGRSGTLLGPAGSVEISRLTSPAFGSDNLWENAAAHSPDDTKDRTDIRVPLPRPLEGGEEVIFEIEFQAQLPGIVERTGYHGDFHLIAQWFPKLAKREVDGTWAHFPFHPFSEFYADFGDYDVTMDVPAEMVVGSTGTQVELPSSEVGRRRIRARAAHVHDFAWTAWAGFVAEERQLGRVKTTLLMPPHLPRTREITWRTIESGLEHFGDAYGEYPYAQLTVVHPPASAARAGGMEYPQFITTGGTDYLPLVGIRAVELLTIHELGHQWFQGVIATNEYEAPFLDEGINSFAEWRYLAETYGEKSLVNWPWLNVSRETGGRYASLQGGRNQPPGLKAAEFSSFGVLANRVYARTPLCLESLGRVFGPQNLHAALRRYSVENRFKHPRSEEFFSAIEQEMGIRARDQLELMLLQNAGIDLALGEVEVNQKLSTSNRGSVMIHRAGSLELPFEVELTFANGDRQLRRLHGDKRTWRLAFEHDSELVGVHIDPERKLLVDDDLLNNSWTRETLGARAFQFHTAISWATWALLLGTP